MGYPERAERLLKECKFDFYIAPTEYTCDGAKVKCNHCKAKVIRELGENAEIFNHAYTFHAFMFVMRKSSVTIELLTEWRDTMYEHPEWLNGDISDEPKQKLLYHSLDQCILSVIIYNWVRKRKHNIPGNYPIVKITYKNNDIVKIDDSDPFIHNYKYYD